MTNVEPARVAVNEPRPYRHTLVVGGTGMLFAASVELAAFSDTMTSVARTSRSLEKVDAAAQKLCPQHHTLQQDWSNEQAFLDGVERHLSATSLPDLVVAWIHADELALKLAERLSARGFRHDFFHVVGSARRNPLHVANEARSRLGLPGDAANYHQVVLGAKRSGVGVRWLTDDEISSGVMEAIRSGSSLFVVGEVL